MPKKFVLIEMNNFNFYLVIIVVIINKYIIT